jgi:hypothetical protein
MMVSSKNSVTTVWTSRRVTNRQKIICPRSYRQAAEDCKIR